MYKLTYFAIPGRGEPIRLLFAAAGVKFVDNRITFQDWPALKESLGGIQLPILEFGDKKLTQSKAIYRYLGRKFKLTGADEWEAAKCDEVVDSVGDLLEEFVVFHFKETDPEKKEEKKKTFYSTTLPTYLGRLNKLQLENGGTWLVGKSMTWADITVAEYLRQLCQSDPAILNGYPNVKKMKEAVFDQENIKSYCAGAK